MPIEVRELVIRATVEDIASNNGDSSGGGNNASGGSSSALTDHELQSIIEECTQAVLKIIERQKNR